MIGEEPIVAPPRPREASESRTFTGQTGDATFNTGHLREIERRKGEEAAAVAGLKDVFFGFDSWTISEEAKPSLLHDAAWLRRNAGKSLVIEGHCDERGTLAYNLVLGDSRAKIIRSFLVDQQIAGDRLVAVSYGKERPFCREQTRRATNAIVEGISCLTERANKRGVLTASATFARRFESNGPPQSVPKSLLGTRATI